MRYIPLTRGMSAVVSDRDYAWLMQWRWRALKSKRTYYAIRHNYIDGVDHIIYMHRAVLGFEGGDSRKVDHRNGNGLHNNRRNLRVATLSQNQMNRRMFKNATGFKGVKKSNLCEGWSARIKMNGKEIYLGFYDSPEKAHAAYRKAAKKYFGRFARAV